AYAAWWTTKLCDLTGNNGRFRDVPFNLDFSRQWYDWIYQRVMNNAPYDQIVAGIVLATGRRDGESFADYCKEMSTYVRKDHPADFSQREMMPHFWARLTVQNPQEKALSFSYSFLGVRLECAQCHKHPFDQWTKQDFDQFAAFFNGVRSSSAPPKSAAQEMKRPFGIEKLDQDSGDYKRQFVKLLSEGNVLPFQEVSVPRQRQKPTSKAGKPGAKFGRVITPRLLGGDEVLTYEYPDPRQPLLDWMQQDDNPYFA